MEAKLKGGRKSRSQSGVGGGSAAKSAKNGMKGRRTKEQKALTDEHTNAQAWIVSPLVVLVEISIANRDRVGGDVSLRFRRLRVPLTHHRFICKKGKESNKNGRTYPRSRPKKREEAGKEEKAAFSSVSDRLFGRR